MTYPVWPTVFENPDSPLSYQRELPLIAGDQSALGLPTSARVQTRETFAATGKLIILPSLFQTFFLFWRDTLNNGKSIFTAPWLTEVGHPEYVARMVTYQFSTLGIMPVVSMTLELIPDVNLDPTQTFPDPWPVL